MRGLLQDVRYAWRGLRKKPGFALLAILILALGIGASTTMFGVMNAVLLRPLPFPHSDRLVRIFSKQNADVVGPSPPDLRDFAVQNHTFEKMALSDVWLKNVNTDAESSEPEQMQVGLVPAEYFEVLGVEPLMGRLFNDEENRWGNQYEAILSYNLWQRRFDADPKILGKTIRINDEPYTIIAVMKGAIPDWWAETRHGVVELWTPFVPYLSASAAARADDERASRGWDAIGRLKPGVSIQQARADLERIAQNLASQYPEDRGVGVIVRSLKEDRVGNLRPIILLLMGAVFLILLIACSNVANLLLARNSGRTREFAVRVAMGAERATLIRQFAVENLTLAGFGGFLGSSLAWLACSEIAAIPPAKLPQLAEVGVDFRVLAFGVAISILSSLFFGTVPVWMSLKVNPADAFKEGGRANIAGRNKKWLRQSLVAGEMALAVMLLVGTGLLVQSLVRLQQQDPGFRVDHLLRTRFFLPPLHYPNSASITRFCDEYLARVRQLPGVQEATIAAANPPDSQWMQDLLIEGRPISLLEEAPSAARNFVDSHYLRTMAIPLLKGRDFSASDSETSVPVALVNQAFVHRYFPAESVIGKQIRASGEPQHTLGSNETTIRFTIIGVIGNAMNRGPALPPLPEIVTLSRQTSGLNVGFKNLLVRTAFDPLQVAPSIRQQLHSVDPTIPLAQLATMNQIMAQQTSDRRYTTGLLALFTLFGMLLAGIGVYGVVSFVVSQRVGEIGLRMALGAKRRDVHWMVVKQGLIIAAIGAVAGLFAAWIFRYLVAQLVFDISTTDPATFASASLLLIAIAMAACYIPARRAARVDPMVSLRYE